MSELSIETDSGDTAETEKDFAQAELFRQQADKESLLVEGQRITLLRQIHDDAFGNASDVHNRVWHFNDAVTQESCMICYTHLVRWWRMDSSLPVEIVLTTGGGDAWQGYALVDQMLALRAKGLHIQVTVRGTAASMGAVLLQAADWRVMGSRSTLLIHKIQGGVEGSLDQIEDITKWYSIINEQGLDLLAERCAEAAPATATKPFTRAQIKAGMSRKDWSIGPAEALAGGLVDEIA